MKHMRKFREKSLFASISHRKTMLRIRNRFLIFIVHKKRYKTQADNKSPVKLNICHFNGRALLFANAEHYLNWCKTYTLLLNWVGVISSRPSSIQLQTLDCGRHLKLMPSFWASKVQGIFMIKLSKAFNQTFQWIWMSRGLMIYRDWRKEYQPVWATLIPI